MTTSLPTIGAILVAMTALSLIEVAVPLHERGRWHRDHLVPNLALTFLTFATNAIMNVGVLLMLDTIRPGEIGWAHTFCAVLALDFSFYLAHRAMHASPVLWRFHAVHHSDPVVDVTTTIRQHPVEGLVRYAFLAVAALAVGATPSAFAVYRVWSVLNGLLEHANVRVPIRLDRALSLVIVTPNMHKVHHSRTKIETNTNYGNMTSLYDRLFGSFTSSARGVNIAYGLDGFDDPALQTTAGLLALPFLDPARREGEDQCKEPSPWPRSWGLSSFRRTSFGVSPVAPRVLSIPPRSRSSRV